MTVRVSPVLFSPGWLIDSKHISTVGQKKITLVKLVAFLFQLGRTKDWPGDISFKNQWTFHLKVPMRNAWLRARRDPLCLWDFPSPTFRRCKLGERFARQSAGRLQTPNARRINSFTRFWWQGGEGDTYPGVYRSPAQLFSHVPGTPAPLPQTFSDVCVNTTSPHACFFRGSNRL